MSDFAAMSPFRFSVTLPGTDADTFYLQEVSGLGVQDTFKESVTEGGQSSVVRHLPISTAKPNLLLKRGVAPANGSLARWCRDVLEGGLATPITPQDLTITLRNESGDAVATWQVGAAYPVKWSIGAFDAMKNEMAIEMVELAYTTIRRKA